VGSAVGIASSAAAVTPTRTRTRAPTRTLTLSLIITRAGALTLTLTPTAASRRVPDALARDRQLISLLPPQPLPLLLPQPLPVPLPLPLPPLYAPSAARETHRPHSQAARGGPRSLLRARCQGHHYR